MWGLGDLAMALTFSYSAADLVLQWPMYETCDSPLHKWLLFSYGLMAAFRYCQHLICKELDELDDTEFFFHLTDRTTLGPKVVSYGLLMPAILAWTMIGTSWTRACMAKACAMDDFNCSAPWFIVIWLLFCYLFIAVQIFFLIVSLTIRFRVERLRQQWALVGVNERSMRPARAFLRKSPGICLKRLNRIAPAIQLAPPIQPLTHSYTHPQTHPSTHSSPHLPTHLPGRPDLLTSQLTSQLTSPVSVHDTERGAHISTCAICLDCLNYGQWVRRMPTCLHWFHRECADTWLSRKAICPVCNTTLTHDSPQLIPSSPTAQLVSELDLNFSLF